jgi:hypothetical protein
MKALSLLQPWASLVVSGSKNRRWHLSKSKKRLCNKLIPNGSRCSVMLDADDPRVACDLCTKGVLHV